MTISIPLLPNGDPLPLPYRWFRVHGLNGLTPWHFYDDVEAIAKWRATYQKESGRDAWPFAYRQNRGDVAAFPMRCGRISSRVIILDNDPLDRWPGEGKPRPLENFRNFTDWLLIAI